MLGTDASAKSLRAAPRSVREADRVREGGRAAPVGAGSRLHGAEGGVSERKQAAELVAPRPLGSGRQGKPPKTPDPQNLIRMPIVGSHCEVWAVVAVAVKIFPFGVGAK